MNALKNAIEENEYITDTKSKKNELEKLYHEVKNTEDDTEVLKQIAAMLLRIKVDLSGNDTDFGDVLKALLFAPKNKPHIREDVLCPGENYIRCRRIEASDGVIDGLDGIGARVAATGGKRKTRKHKKKGKKKTMKKKGKKKTIKRKKGKKKSKKRGKKKTVKRRSKKSRK
tara:strand:+ start:111 stop:623 length:513 start_codon:yes stop_codon:yes gene_type:complete